MTNHIESDMLISTKGDQHVRPAQLERQKPQTADTNQCFCATGTPCDQRDHRGHVDDGSAPRARSTGGHDQRFAQLPHNMAGEIRNRLTAATVGLLLAVGLTSCGSSLSEETPRDAAVWIADSPSNWTRIDDAALGGVGEQQITSVTVFEDLIVAGGFETINGDRDARVWISGNGSDWEKIVDPDFGGAGEQTIWSIAKVDNGLVAGGTTGDSLEVDAAVWHSLDGRNWERAPTELSFTGPGDQAILTVVGFDDRIFAAGDDYLDAAVWVSTDGSTWTLITDAALGGEGEQTIYQLEVTEHGLLAVGDDNRDAAMWVLEGESWKKLDQPAFGGPGHQVIQDVASFSNGLIAVGGVFEYDDIYFLGRGVRGQLDALVWFSADGTTWTRVEADAVLAGRGHQVMEQTVAWGSTLVGVGYDLAGRGNVVEGLAARGSGLDVDAGVWVSHDGMDWEYIVDSDLGGDDWQDIWDIVIVPEIGAVAVGGDDLGTSVDS